MKKENIVNSVKMILLAVILIMLFFISTSLVNFIVALPVATLEKVVYVVLASSVIHFYTNLPTNNDKK